VVAIAAAVAGIALPRYVSGAKDTTLVRNLGTLELQVKSLAALDLDPTFLPDPDRLASASAGDPADYQAAVTSSISVALATTLRQGVAGDTGRFVNPVSHSTAVVCQSAPPWSNGDAQPAVWITNDEEYVYEALSTGGKRDCLAGTLLVVFHEDGPDAGTIEVYYVDSAGQPTPQVATLAF
jgi:type II secretory pathway pseudopilin PulG